MPAKFYQGPKFQGELCEPLYPVGSSYPVGSWPEGGVALPLALELTNQTRVRGGKDEGWPKGRAWGADPWDDLGGLAKDVDPSPLQQKINKNGLDLNGAPDFCGFPGGATGRSGINNPAPQKSWLRYPWMARLLAHHYGDPLKPYIYKKGFIYPLYFNSFILKYTNILIKNFNILRNKPFYSSQHPYLSINLSIKFYLYIYIKNFFEDFNII